MRHASRLRLLLSVALFLLLFGFLPSIACQREVAVSGKVCKAMGFCVTDLHVSALVYLFSDCQYSREAWKFALLLLSYALGSYVIASAAEMLYRTYRDI